MKKFFATEFEDAALKTQTSLAYLNFGQNAIFSAALSTAMVLCSYGIMNNTMTVGDLVIFLVHVMSLPKQVVYYRKHLPLSF